MTEIPWVRPKSTHGIRFAKLEGVETLAQALKFAHTMTARGVRITGLLIGLLVLPVLVAAQDGTSLTTEDCLACHADESVTRADGRPVSVSAEAFAASVHGVLACSDCHADLASTELPHVEKAVPVTCALCHEEAVSKYEAGIHAQARAADALSPAARCIDCHGVHDIRRSSDPDSRTHHLKLAATCARCHGDPEIIERGHIAIGDVAWLFEDSIHGQALSRAGLMVAPTCSDCHGNHDIVQRTDPSSRIHRTNVAATCGRCHEGIGRLYNAGVHAEAIERGNPKAPVCHDCHTAHGIQRAEVTGWRLDVIRECGTCHEESIKTYRDTFHGQVTALGYTRVAACADCHGAHDIQPKSNERSTINPTHLVQTCRKCHEGATESFVQYGPHADKHDRERTPWLFYASKLMSGLLIGVFSFFGVHTILWTSRSAALPRRNGSARRPADDESTTTPPSRADRKDDDGTGNA